MFNVDIGQVAFAAFGLLVWFLRLEGTVKSLKRENELLEKRIDDVHGDHKSLAKSVVIELVFVKESLARIEGKLSQ